MFERNRSDFTHILQHIRENETSIFLGFKGKPEIEQLSQKIIKNAERFEYWDKDRLIGLFACYYNNFKTLTGFITIASISKELRNKGIGSELLKRTLEFGYEMNFKRIKLEVNTKNHRAIKFYNKFGFIIEKQCKNTLVMVKSIIKNETQ